ncbi:MAG: DUF4440 domain-containing protein [Thermoguttaceae bacterium]|jgi:calcium/calmodulin-dependent protein kinase (CaM kinase) II
MSTEESDVSEVLELTQQFLDSIANADWETYSALCDPSLSAFEPESLGHLIEGMDFHRFYFDRGGIQGPHNTTIASPHVRLLGDTAIVSYVRIVQRLDAAGHPTTSHSQETRVWHRENNVWRHVHFHRSIA